MEQIRGFLVEQFDNVNKFESERYCKNEESWYEDGGLSDFNRDYARILYSSAFRRQQGKMQLLEVNGKSFYRNRLTHSFEVAQIARGIVEHLKQISKINNDLNFIKTSRVVESASLIHDIGNPPFGHHGEKILDSLGRLNGIRYEGNAQSIRILTNLEKKSPEYNGLNLTLRTLAGIIKYNISGENSTAKKFIYKEDYNQFNDKFKKLDVALRTLDVQIVDLADEIAYCAHDLEDTLASNYFTMDEFIHNLSDGIEGDEGFKDFLQWVEDSRVIAKNANQFDDFNFYFRNSLISKIVNGLIGDVGIVKLDDKFKEKTGTQYNVELGFKNYSKLSSKLKKTIFKEVTKSDNIILYENMGSKVLKSLYEMYIDESYNRDAMLLPIEYRWKKGENTKYQKVLDYLGGMMDTYAIETYKKHFGNEPFDYEVGQYEIRNKKNLFDCFRNQFFK